MNPLTFPEFLFCNEIWKWKLWITRQESDERHLIILVIYYYIKVTPKHEGLNKNKYLSSHTISVGQELDGDWGSLSVTKMLARVLLSQGLTGSGGSPSRMASHVTGRLLIWLHIAGWQEASVLWHTIPPQSRWTVQITVLVSPAVSDPRESKMKVAMSFMIKTWKKAHY